MTFWRQGWDLAAVISVSMFGTIIMLGKYGLLKEFLPDEDSIGAYLEHASLYFVVNGIKEDRRVRILLSSIGARTYSLLRDLIAPVLPGTLPFDQISEVLASHIQPRHLVIAERFHFNRGVQTVEENSAKFDAALRKLATYCKFERPLDWVEETLHDLFVCGLCHEVTQCWLLTEHVLTAVVAKSMKAVDSNTRLLKTWELPINKVLHLALPGTERKPCDHCGKTAHFPYQSCCKDAYCHTCGKKGHIAWVCESAPRGKSSPTQVWKKPGRQKLNMNRVHNDQKTSERESTVDRETFAVKIVLRWWFDREIKTPENFSYRILSCGKNSWSLLHRETFPPQKIYMWNFHNAINSQSTIVVRSTQSIPLESIPMIRSMSKCWLMVNN